MKRLLLSIVVIATAAVAGLLMYPAPPVEAVDAGDVIGAYALKLSGNGFDRDGNDGAIDQGKVRGNALLVISRANAAADPRLVRVAITLEKNLRRSLLDRATPSPAALEGVGILVDDSLTVIGAGQANFVNAITLRFARKGKKVTGVWLASFPGSDVDQGFVAGVGVTLKGKRLRAASVAPPALVR
jgi:hypothetical protein